MRNLFPSKLVKEQIQDLNQMTPLFGGLTWSGFPTPESAYEDIKARLTRELLKKHEIVQKAREHESWQGVRVYNLCAIVEMAFDAVAGGHYHLIRGMLTMQGEGYSHVCTTAAGELVKMGAWPADSTRRLSEDLSECIRNIG
jgi:hypothetical protein